MKDTLAKNVRDAGSRVVEADARLGKALRTWLAAIMQGDKEAARIANACIVSLQEQVTLLQSEYVKHQKIWKEAAQ